MRRWHPETATRDEDPMPESKRHPARRPQQRTPRSSHRDPARPKAAPEPALSPWRRSLERHSAGPLVILHRMPTWLVPVLLAVLLVAGLALTAPASGLLLLVPAAFLAWLLALAWPITSTTGRALRVFAVGALLVVAVLKLAGRF
jgi:hypothetical protein